MSQPSKLIETRIAMYQAGEETLCEFAWRVVNDVFRYGTDEEKQDCIKSFYQRVFWEGEIELVSVHKGVFGPEFVIAKDGVEYRIESESWKFKANGRYIKDANLADVLGVPVAFLDGLAIAVAFCQQMVSTERKQKELIAALQAERKKLEATKRSLNKKLSIGNAGSLERRKVIKSLRRAAEKEIERKQHNNGVATAEQKFWKALSARCDLYELPPVPRPEIRRSKLMQMKPFSGLYFEWDGLLCTYVGKSINVPSRVTPSHHKLTGDPLMSFIEMDKSLIGRHELFYIWLLNPAKNGGLD